MKISKKHILGTSATVLSLAALLHATRIAMGWNLVVGSWAVPTWFSGLAVVLAGYLAYETWKMVK